MADMKKITDFSEFISSENFEKTMMSLYGDFEGQAERYAALFATHNGRFPNCGGGYFYSSPGRIEVIGNHTDHNHGKVVAAAITVDTLAFVTPSDDEFVVICSAGYAPIKINLNCLETLDSEKGTSIALVKGVAKYFLDSGYRVGGFLASTTSDVFKGAGVSSSAAFELLVAEIFNDIYNDGSITAIKKAIAAQFAENVFFGKPCGLMDQSAIALGGVSMIDFKDVKNPEVVNMVWPFREVDIVITNTGGDHADLTYAYAAIRTEMEEIAKFFGERTLREVEYSKFINSVAELRQFGGRAVLRAAHFFDENQRVDRAVAAITYNNADGFFKAVKESGDSSFKYLQNCFVEGDKNQNIPVALMLSERQEGVKAARVHGGGFAGTVIAYVEKSCTYQYIEKMKSVFGGENVFKLNIRESGSCRVEV